LASNPALALLGPRQCGKSTLARHLLSSFPDAAYLDLELPSDRNKLLDAEGYLRMQAGRLVCLDEIQRAPELFPVLRGLIDQQGVSGQYLILGSASRDLIRQSSETLAGRLAYLELTPFLLSEVGEALSRLWLQGGFPRSYAADCAASFSWRSDFVRSFLERDVPMLRSGLQPDAVGRLLLMSAHSHGQLLNMEKLAGSMGVDAGTVRNYLDLLCGAFVMRRLPPFVVNVKKRLVKRPKLYLRDSGLLHQLLRLETMDDLFGHPVYGASWEGLVIEQILSMVGDRMDYGFYRTSNGAEMDLVLSGRGRRIGVECKASVAPKVTRGFWNAKADLNLDETYVVAPVQEAYPIGDGVTVCSLGACLGKLASR
jgi:predicted AAA+ superfamily ATPase